MSHYPHYHRRGEDPPDEVFDRQPPAMTKEQLDYFTECTERAVRKGVREGVRRYRNNALVGFIALFAGFLFNANNNRDQDKAQRQFDANARSAIVASGRVVSVDGCNRAFEERLKIRDVFKTSRRLVRDRLNSGTSANPASDKLALAFNTEQLKRFKLPDCRKAESLLTDDPTKPLPSVEPWYPGSDNPAQPQPAGR